jgi:hypothetical protein
LFICVTPGGAGGVSDEHPFFIFNLEAARPRLGFYNVAAAPVGGGLLAGAPFLNTGNSAHGCARQQSTADGLMAAELANESGAASDISTNPPASTPYVFGSITEVLESGAADSGPGAGASK